MGCRSPGAPTGLRFLTQRVHQRAGKGASWPTHSVLGGLRKSFVCLRAHSALKQTLDFETAPGTAGATTQGGEHCFPRQEPGWKRPHATLKAVAFSPLLSRQKVFTPASQRAKSRPPSAGSSSRAVRHGLGDPNATHTA